MSAPLAALLRIPDLMAETRVASALAADGIAATAVPSGGWATAVAGASATSPQPIAVVDLGGPGSFDAIAAAVAAGLTVVAFGPHVDEAGLAAARTAGAARVHARGDFLRHAAQRVREAAQR